MNETVLLDTYVDKSTKIRYVAYDSRKHHPFFQVFNGCDRFVKFPYLYYGAGSLPGLSSSVMISLRVGIPTSEET